MLGNLEPEENVMNDIPKHDWTQNKDGFFAWEDGGIMDNIQYCIEALGWNPEDEIDVEIGGTAVSGIDVGEEYNKKWQSPIGTRKYNKDAFIVIKNRSRSPFQPSQPMKEFNARHKYEQKLEN